MVLVGRKVDALEEAQKQCANVADTLAVQADLVNEADVAKVVDETVSKYGKIDSLVAYFIICTNNLRICR